MMKMVQTVFLKHGDSITLEFEGRKDVLEISGSGILGRANEQCGSVEYLFNDTPRANTACAQTNDVGKLDKIGHYLQLLYEAQKVNHAVHTEIDEALKRFKQEAGI